MTGKPIDIDKVMEALLAALTSEDDKASITLGVGLVASVLTDLRRIADALEAIAAEHVRPPGATLD